MVRIPIAGCAYQSQSAVLTELDKTFAAAVIEELRPIAQTNAIAEFSEYEQSDKILILVVEDNPEMNQFICETLGETYRVLSAFNGAEGLEKATLLSPSLIVTDVMMPGVTGVEMIENLRTDSEFDDVPIVVLTAKADEELKIQLLEGGAQDFVSKPFSSKDLLVRIKNQLDLKKFREKTRLMHQQKLYNDQLQLAFAELQNLAYVVSHELQEPLQTIKSYQNLLSVRYKGRLGADADEFIERCSAAINVTKKMIDDLWEYARVGHQSFSLTTVDSNKSLSKAVTALEPLINGTNARLDFETLPDVIANDTLLAALFTRILDNAIRHTQLHTPRICIRLLVFCYNRQWTGH